MIGQSFCLILSRLIAVKRSEFMKTSGNVPCALSVEYFCGIHSSLLRMKKLCLNHHSTIMKCRKAFWYRCILKSGESVAESLENTAIFPNHENTATNLGSFCACRSFNWLEIGFWTLWLDFGFFIQAAHKIDHLYEPRVQVLWKLATNEMQMSSLNFAFQSASQRDIWYETDHVWESMAASVNCKCHL